MRRQSTTRNRGSASIVAVITVTLIAGMSGAVLALTMRSKTERSWAVARHEALDGAKSGFAHALANMKAGTSADLGTAEAPVAFGGGGYWTTVTENEADGTWIVRSTGFARNEVEAIEVVLSPAGSTIYDNAIFAGNTDEDPLYTMDFGGKGEQADEIDGDIYSGGSIEVSEDAALSGTLRASGDIHGESGEEGVVLVPPDLEAMDYENTADFDVLDLFLAGGYTYSHDAAGGYAFQVPESNPAHIFRVNPSDRSAQTSATPKLDFFLEDPYEPVSLDGDEDGSDPYEISLSGISGEPGPDGNHKVYFIDGNLWIHNYNTYTMMFEHDEANGVQVTFVVKGNIYMSDNVYLDDSEHDGIAFIAMTDPTVADSGNIYFGDPTFGTLSHMSGYMYAENNFYDINLPAEGSETVHLEGNMTAGNQVLIERDWVDHHTKLIVDFDERVSTGELEMPGLPLDVGVGSAGYDVLSWRRVPVE